MIYPYKVKHNGVIYEAGVNVPDENEPLVSDAVNEDSGKITITLDNEPVIETVKKRGRPKK